MSGRVRGPKVNVDVAFYYGIDGHAEWRTMDELNQPWVLGRHAHEYRGDEAVEVTRLTAAAVVAYVHQHTARPQLPFGGYYTLGGVPGLGFGDRAEADGEGDAVSEYGGCAAV